MTMNISPVERVLGALVASAFAANQAVAQQQERGYSGNCGRGNGSGCIRQSRCRVVRSARCHAEHGQTSMLRTQPHQLPETVVQRPRWGVIGSRALPDGAPNLIFKLEGEYLLDTGEEDTPGVLFTAMPGWASRRNDGQADIRPPEHAGAGFFAHYAILHCERPVTLDEAAGPTPITSSS